jgi:hypothetical protein
MMDGCGASPQRHSLSTLSTTYTTTYLVDKFLQTRAPTRSFAILVAAYFDRRRRLGGGQYECHCWSAVVGWQGRQKSRHESQESEEGENNRTTTCWHDKEFSFPRLSTTTLFAKRYAMSMYAIIEKYGIEDGGTACSRYGGGGSTVTGKDMEKISSSVSVREEKSEALVLVRHLAMVRGASFC